MCAGYRFPAEVIATAVWLYRLPLSLRMVEEMLAPRGIAVSRETVRAWGLTFGPVCRTEVLGCGRVSTDEQTTETLMRTTVP